MSCLPPPPRNPACLASRAQDMPTSVTPTARPSSPPVFVGPYGQTWVDCSGADAPPAAPGEACSALVPRLSGTIIGPTPHSWSREGSADAHLPGRAHVCECVCCVTQAGRQAAMWGQKWHGQCREVMQGTQPSVRGEPRNTRVRMHTHSPCTPQARWSSWVLWAWLPWRFPAGKPFRQCTAGWVPSARHVLPRQVQQVADPHRLYAAAPRAGLRLEGPTRAQPALSVQVQSSVSHGGR